MDWLFGYVAIFGCSIGAAGALLTLNNPKRGPFEVKFIWYDLWVGAYWSREKQTLYILPLPCVVFIFNFQG